MMTAMRVAAGSIASDLYTSVTINLITISIAAASETYATVQESHLVYYSTVNINCPILSTAASL